MRVRRGQIRDTFTEGGRCAVFVNNQVVVLSEIATSILDAMPTQSATTLDEVTRAVVKEFGEPEPPLDATELTRHQLLDLVAHHVLLDADSFAHESSNADSVAALRDALRHLVSPATSPWQLPAAVTRQFVATVQLHRLAPLVVRNLDRLDLPPEVSTQLLANSAYEATTTHRQAEELHEIFTRLESVGVRALTFKGLALAAQAHGDFTARGPGDHDLLVHPSDIARAHAALTSLGWIPSHGFARPGSSWAWRHLVRNYHELPMVRGQSSVDLHWHLGSVRTAFPSFDDLWIRRVVVEVAGRDVPTLSPYDALAHSSTHAAKDGWTSLRSLLDVHRLMSDPCTWGDADRELRNDQLLSVGLAARFFGIPDGAPSVVATAAERSSAVAGPAELGQSSRVLVVESSRRIPIVSLAPELVGLGRAGARPADYWRQVWRYLLPVTDFAGDSARHAPVAVPRLLARRGREVGRLWTARAAARRRHTSRTRESGHVGPT